jgi:plasmid stabilization system protein ParE
MKPRFKVKLSLRAERQIDRARDWRTTNLGTLAADDMDDELREAFERLKDHPDSGAPVETRSKRSGILRRVILDGCGYHVYYRAEHAEHRILVGYFWHGRRRPPRVVL